MEALALQLVDVHNKLKDVKQKNESISLSSQRDKLIESMSDLIKKKELDTKISNDEEP